MNLIKSLFIVMIFFGATSLKAEDVKKFKAQDGTEFELLLQTVRVDSELRFTMRIESPDTYKITKYKFFDFVAWCDENVLKIEQTSYGDCFNCNRSGGRSYSIYDTTGSINLNQDAMSRDVFVTVCKMTGH